MKSLVRTTNHFRFRVKSIFWKFVFFLPLKFYNSESYLQNPHCSPFSESIYSWMDLRLRNPSCHLPRLQNTEPAVPTVTLKRSVAIDNGTPKEGLMFQRLARRHLGTFEDRTFWGIGFSAPFSQEFETDYGWNDKLIIYNLIIHDNTLLHLSIFGEGDPFFPIFSYSNHPSWGAPGKSGPPTGWVKTRHLSDHEDPNRATYHVPSFGGTSQLQCVCLTNKIPIKISGSEMIWIPWESKTKQRMVFRVIHEKDSRSYQWAKFGLCTSCEYFPQWILKPIFECKFSFAKETRRGTKTGLAISFIGARFMCMAMVRFAGLSNRSCWEKYLLRTGNFWTLTCLANFVTEYTKTQKRYKKV